MPKTKFDKKKEHERKSKEKVLKRRKSLRATAKDEREAELAEQQRRKAYEKANAVALRIEKEYETMPEDTKSQLEKNVEILRALEVEYDKEENQRRLAQEMQISQQIPRRKEKASAEVVFTPHLD